MDPITRTIVIDLIKTGHPAEMISFELGLSLSDINRVWQSAEQAQTTNILIEQLASRLPALLELSMKQLEKILLNSDSDRRLKAAGLILQTASNLARLKY